jgi:hypothetical protein
MGRLLVERRSPLPDFRVVLAFLWGDGHPVDTEGDCRYPADRDWPELYMRSRETSEMVELLPADVVPSTFVVESANPELAARVAYFLMAETGARVTDGAGVRLDASVLVARTGPGFSIEAAIDRAAASPFRRATQQDPYPARE